MAEIFHIADIRQRIEKTDDQLGAAASREGWGDNSRLIHFLETVEKTLVHNAQQIRRLKRIVKIFALFTVISWILIAALIADRVRGIP